MTPFRVVETAGAYERRPFSFALTPPTALLKAQGWRIVHKCCVKDGSRLMAVGVFAARPES